MSQCKKMTPNNLSCLYVKIYFFLYFGIKYNQDVFWSGFITQITWKINLRYEKKQ